jgi:hypothetical protein
MNKIIFTISMVFFISSCSSDQVTRNRYASSYQQPNYYIQIYQQKINNMSVEELAKEGASIEKSRMKGQSSLKLDNFITIENVSSKENKVIFDYSLSNNWSALTDKKQNAYKNKMQKDLIYRTCSLKTVRLAQEKGLEEEHKYYESYLSKLIFTLKTNKQICINNGFI